MEVAQIQVRGIGAEGLAEIVVGGGEVGVAGIEVGEGCSHVGPGRVGEEAGVVGQFVDATEEGHGRGIVRAEHVGHHATFEVIDVATGDVPVMGEAVFLLPDGKGDFFVEGPLDPEFGEAVVEGFEVAAADHLGMEAEFFEEAGLEAEAVAAGFIGLAFASGAVGPVILAMVTAEEPELLEDGVGVALVEASEVFPFFAEGGGGGEGGGNDFGRLGWSRFASGGSGGADHEGGEGESSELAEEGVGGRWVVWHEETIFDIESWVCQRSDGFLGH